MIDSVVAGTPDFVARLGPTLREQVGADPRVASDPRQAFTLCAQTGGLLVVEYGGADWLPVVRDLRSLCGEAISVVVAVSPDRLSEVRQLQHAGADEVVPWEGRAESVGWAIQRALSAKLSPSATPTPPPVLTYVAPGGPPPPVLQRAAASVAAPATAPAPDAPAVPAPAAPPASRAAPAASAWPAGLPGAEASAQLLAEAIAGLASAAPASPALAAAKKLSQPERDAVVGGALPVDAAVIRRAAVLRFRVQMAIDAAPRAGEGIDGAAVQTLLAEIDGVLAELKALEEGAPEQVRPGLDAIRSGLVSEAIDLTETVQRLSPAVPAPVAEVPHPAPRRAVEKKAARPVNAELKQFEGLQARRSLRTKLIGLLVVAGLAAAGYHLRARLESKPPRERPTMPGAPAGAVAPTNGRSTTRLVSSGDGKPFTPEQVERFRKEQAERGNEVVQVSPSTLVVRPAGGNK